MHRRSGLRYLAGMRQSPSVGNPVAPAVVGTLRHFAARMQTIRSAMYLISHDKCKCGTGIAPLVGKVLILWPSVGIKS